MISKTDYLKELKNHDWAYRYAEGEAYRKGQANDDRLSNLANDNAELQALYAAYSNFFWDGGEEPSIEKESAQPTQSIYNKRAIMLDAWKLARKAAKRFGNPAKSFFAESLKTAWAKIKAAALNTFSAYDTSSKEVYTICIDEKISRNKKLINLLVINEYFTDRQLVISALSIIRASYPKAFIKTAAAIQH